MEGRSGGGGGSRTYDAADMSRVSAAANFLEHLLELVLETGQGENSQLCRASNSSRTPADLRRHPRRAASRLDENRGRAHEGGQLVWNWFAVQSRGGRASKPGRSTSRLLIPSVKLFVREEL